MVIPTLNDDAMGDVDAIAQNLGRFVWGSFSSVRQNSHPFSSIDSEVIALSLNDAQRGAGGRRMALDSLH